MVTNLRDGCLVGIRKISCWLLSNTQNKNRFSSSSSSFFKGVSLLLNDWDGSSGVAHGGKAQSVSIWWTLSEREREREKIFHFGGFLGLCPIPLPSFRPSTPYFYLPDLLKHKKSFMFSVPFFFVRLMRRINVG